MEDRAAYYKDKYGRLQGMGLLYEESVNYVPDSFLSELNYEIGSSSFL